MRRNNKCLQVLFLVFAMLLLSSCQASIGETAKMPSDEETPEKEVLHLSVASAAYMEGVVTGEVVLDAIDKMEEWSDGTIEVVLHDGGELGGDDILMKGAVQGTLSIVNAVSSAQVETVPEVALLGIPCMFESTEQFNRLIESEYGERLQEYYNKAGLQLLACFGDNYRNLTANSLITSVEEIRGLKMRTLDNPYHIAFWRALGADASYYNFNDLYTALQQGVYEAQENPNTAIIGARLHDVQRYVINTRHVIIDNIYVMNKEQWDALTDDQQALIRKFMEYIRTEQISRGPEKYRLMDQELVDSFGMTVFEPSGQFLEELSVGKDAVIKLLRQDLGDVVVDDFLAAVESVKAAER